ncbi:MAG TPA: 2Fe-2S iron-sulfur cluster-binding protein [Candidatus Acidoferrum sp.]|jgi:xanthine dehydrogenase YagT iron-sulfur-binding subunit
MDYEDFGSDEAEDFAGESADDAELSTRKVRLSVDGEENLSEFTRREFVATTGILTAGISLGWPTFSSAASTIVNPDVDTQSDANAIAVAVGLVVNGAKHQLNLDPRVTLLDALRENLALTGTKKGCDHGQCGACTVLVNGRRINSCLALAVAHDGDKITTIEGIANGEELHPVQAAFLEHDGFQCGYCTPGQICSAVGMLNEAQEGAASYVTANVGRTSPVELTEDEIRERMSGNICRCGAYPGIVAAVKRSNEVMQKAR